MHTWKKKRGGGWAGFFFFETERAVTPARVCKLEDKIYVCRKLTWRDVVGHVSSALECHAAQCEHRPHPRAALCWLIEIHSQAPDQGMKREMGENWGIC